MMEVLKDGVAREFQCQRPGMWHILVELYGGSPLTLQVARTPSSPWIDTDVTFSDVGVKRFGLARYFYYRLNAADLDSAVAYVSFEGASHG